MAVCDESIHSSLFRSKDSVVQLWNIPAPDPNGDIQSQTALPITCDYPPKEEHGDLTSLDWSADGSLLAIGCYDSILRICDTNGKMYFSHSQHDVSFNRAGTCALPSANRLLRRGLYSPPGSPPEDAGSQLRAWTAQYVFGMYKGSDCIDIMWSTRVRRLSSLTTNESLMVKHPECCLDVDWLSESEFATSGSDGLVQIMNINNPSPLKTLR